VFAIFVKTGRVEEWAPEARAWRAVDLGSSLSDSCLNRPLAAKALLDAATADSEVARALEVKGNPAVVAMKAGSKMEGARQEAANAVLAALTVRGIEVPPQVLATIEGCTDIVTLRRWHARAVIAASADEVIQEP